MSESEVEMWELKVERGQGLFPGALWAKFKKSIQVTGPCMVPSPQRSSSPGI